MDIFRYEDAMGWTICGNVEDKIFSRKLSVGNWTIWNEEYLTAVSIINTDVEIILRQRQRIR